MPTKPSKGKMKASATPSAGHTTLKQTKAMVEWVEVPRNKKILAGESTKGKRMQHGAGITKIEGFGRMADYVYRTALEDDRDDGVVDERHANKWTSDTCQSRWKSLFRRYRKTKERLEKQTGFGVTAEMMARGVTIERAVEKACPYYYRLDTIFCGQANVRPIYAGHEPEKMSDAEGGDTVAHETDDRETVVSQFGTIISDDEDDEEFNEAEALFEDFEEINEEVEIFDTPQQPDSSFGTTPLFAMPMFHTAGQHVLEHNIPEHTIPVTALESQGTQHLIESNRDIDTTRVTTECIPAQPVDSTHKSSTDKRRAKKTKASAPPARTRSKHPVNAPALASDAVPPEAALAAEEKGKAKAQDSKRKDFSSVYVEASTLRLEFEERRLGFDMKWREKQLEREMVWREKQHASDIRMREDEIRLKEEELRIKTRDQEVAIKQKMIEERSRMALQLLKDGMPLAMVKTTVDDFFGNEQ